MGNAEALQCRQWGSQASHVMLFYILKQSILVFCILTIALSWNIMLPHFHDLLSLSSLNQSINQYLSLFEGFLLAYCCRGYSSSWQGRHDGGSRRLTSHAAFIHREQKSGQKVGLGYRDSRLAPSDPLPSVRLWLLNVQLPFQAVCLARCQGFKKMSLWETFHIQTTAHTEPSLQALFLCCFGLCCAKLGLTIAQHLT